MVVGDFPNWFWLSFVMAVGACVGSFLNVVVYRWPRELSLSSPPSACPACGKPIPIYLNLPVIGWLVLRGRAACCKTKISIRYPLIELLGALLAWAIYTFRIAPVAHALPLGSGGIFFFSEYFMSAALVAAAIIDWEEMLIPLEIPMGGFVVGVASSFFRPEVDWLSSLLGGLGSAFCLWFPFVFLYKKLRGMAGMGMGDVYLMLAAGAFFGAYGALFVLFAAAIQGSLFWGISMLFGLEAHEPPGVTRQREELLAAIAEAEGSEKEELVQLLKEDPMGESPEDYQGSPRVAFGPFLALSMIQLTIFYDELRALSLEYFLL